MAIRRVGGDEPERDALRRRRRRRDGSVDEVERDPDLRPLLDDLGDVGAPTSLGISDPRIGQEQPPAHRPVHRRSRPGAPDDVLRRHDGLAVGLLAELAAPLVGHADRVLPLLRNYLR